MQAQIVVLLFPPKLSVSNLVSLLSRKGTWFKFFSLANAEIQLLNAEIDLFIFLASYSLNPSDPVLLRRSLPARSTIVNNAFLWCLFLTNGWGGELFPYFEVGVVAAFSEFSYDSF